MKLLQIHSLQVKLDAEHTAGSSLSLVKYVSQCYRTVLFTMVLARISLCVVGKEEVPYKELGF